MLILNKIFSTPPFKRPWYCVIFWWEIRRIPYNLIVGVCGFLSLLILAIADELPPKLSFEQRDLEPLSFIFFAILANIFFTGGWLFEFIARKLWEEKAGSFGPIAFSLGLIFSMFLAFLPGILNFLFWIIRFIQQFI